MHLYFNDGLLYVAILCTLAPAALVAAGRSEHMSASSPKDGSSIGLAVAMAALVTGLVAVAVGLAVRRVRKSRQNQSSVLRQLSTEFQSTEDVEDVYISGNSKSKVGATDMI